MKIAFLIGLNDLGGAEFVAYQHIMMAWRNHMDVVVLSGTGGKFHNRIKDAGIKIEITGMHPRPDTVARLLARCDVVFNCNWFVITPIVISYKKKIGFRYLTILHSNIDWVYNQVVGYDFYTDGYYAIHQMIVDSFVAKGIMDHRKFTVIPNCVDIEKITNYELGITREKVRKQFGYTDENFVIGMVSRVAADKNILGAIEIVRRLPFAMNMRLLIIGGPTNDDISRNYYKRVLNAIKADIHIRERITITGNLDMEGVYDSIKAFDIGLNCSPSEGLPIALLEMMAAGIPCVMPSVGDIPNILTGRGVVVPIRQRLEGREIHKDPCYERDEIQLFINAIIGLHWPVIRGKSGNRELQNSRGELGKAAAEYVSKFRSLKCQENLFLKFITMKAKSGNNKEQVAGADSRDKEPLEGPLEAQVYLPKVSILMPTRDGNPEWMAQAFGSIVDQDYAGELELVVVNHDCRLSMTKKIEEMLVEAIDKRAGMTGDFKTVYLAVDDDTIQFSQALDKGIEACSGEIIIRMDHDDIAKPQMVSKQVANMRDHPEVQICGVQLHFFGAKEMITNHPAIVTRELAYKMPNWWFVNHPGVAMRKNILLKVGGYGTVKQGFAEDYNLWCKYLKAGYVVYNLPDILVDYRCYVKRPVPEGYVAFLQGVKEGLK
jgi:glycosyltransferase involved in cell wall biosynthesis